MAAQIKKSREGFGLQVMQGSGGRRYVSFIRLRDQGLFAHNRNMPFTGRLTDLYRAFDAFDAEALCFADGLEFKGLDKSSADALKALAIRDGLNAMIAKASL